MRIRIVGAGWYGCHLALALKKRGHHVAVFDKAGHVFAGASGANQSRLHLGFHYPRCAITRGKAVVNNAKFREAYPDLVRPVPLNIYAVASDASMIDFHTYEWIMRHKLPSGSHLIVRPEDYGLKNCEGAMLTGEALIDCRAAARYFEQELLDDFRLGTPVDLAARSIFDFDLTINCTYGAAETAGVEWFEPCVMFIMQGDYPAVTIMDGPDGASLYPWHGGGSSLTSVAETCLGRFESHGAAMARIEGMNADDEAELCAAMVDRMRRYYPDCPDPDAMTGGVYSIRAKPASAADLRDVVVTRNGDRIDVMPGKISGVFDAEALVIAAMCDA